MPEETPAETWAIVEVMGHQRYAGPAFEKHLGPSSIFAITPCTEAVARAAAVQFYAQPTTLLDLPTRHSIACCGPLEDDNCPV